MSKNTEIEIDQVSLDSILAEVEQELEPVLKAEKDRLAKADGDSDGPPKKDEGSEDKGGDKSPPASEDKSGEESAPPAGPDASASAPPAGPPPPPGPDASASAPPPGSAPAGSPPASPGMPTDPAALAQMIASLPMEQQKAVYLASKQALAASMAAGAGAPPAGAPPAGSPPMAPPPGPDASAAGAPPMAPPAAPPAPPMSPPAGAPPADASGAPPMDPTMKMEASPANGGKSVPVKKSEKTVDNKGNKENEELKALVKSQGEKIDLLHRAVQHMAGTPIRKAVTSISALKKTEGNDGKEPKTLTKAEMTTQLTAMIRSRKLNKTDSEKVRKFYDEGSTNFESIAHLFQ